MKGCFFFLLILVSCVAFSQSTSKFAIQFGDNGQDEGRRIIQTLDNGYAIIGSTGSYVNNSSDIYIVKLDSAGFRVWEKYIGKNGVDNGYGILELKDTSYIIVGNTYDVVNGYDQFFARLNKVGDTLWTRYIPSGGWDFLYDVTMQNDSIFIAVGTFGLESSNVQDASIIKFDLHGNILQQKSFGSMGNDEFKSVIIDYDSNIVAVGNTDSYGNGGKDVLVMKLSPSLDSIYLRTYGGVHDDISEKIIQTNDSTKYFMLGSTNSFGGGQNDFYTIVCDTNADTLYTFTLGSYDNEMGYGLCQDFENNIAFAGLTEGPSYHKVLIRKNDVSGNFLFQTQVSGFSNGDSGYNYSDAYDLTTTRDSGYILVGKNMNTTTLQTDVYVVKFDKQFQTATSITKIHGSNAQIEFINPCTTELIFTSKPFGKLYIEIINQVGQIIKVDILDDNTNQLNISSIENGVYFVRCVDANGVQFSTNKFAKYSGE